MNYNKVNNVINAVTFFGNIASFKRIMFKSLNENFLTLYPEKFIHLFGK